MIMTEKEYKEKLSIDQLKELATEYNKQNGNYFYLSGNYMKWGDRKEQKLNLTNDDYKRAWLIDRTTFMTLEEYVSEVKAGNIPGVKHEVINGQGNLVF